MLTKLPKSLAPLGCHYHIIFSQGTWLYTLLAIAHWSAPPLATKEQVYQCRLTCIQYALKRLTIVSALLCQRQSKTRSLFAVLNTNHRVFRNMYLTCQCRETRKFEHIVDYICLIRFFYPTHFCHRKFSQKPLCNITREWSWPVDWYSAVDLSQNQNQGSSSPHHNNNWVLQN